MTKKKRPRTARRRAAREAEKLGDAREKLALLSPGGAEERPIDVVSASVVELEALRPPAELGLLVEHRPSTMTLADRRQCETLMQWKRDTR